LWFEDSLNDFTDGIDFPACSFFLVFLLFFFGMAGLLRRLAQDDFVVVSR
jgi:hypothetical protein